MRSDLVSAGVFGATTLCWFDTPYISLFVDSMFVVLYKLVLVKHHHVFKITNKYVEECSRMFKCARYLLTFV